MVQQFKINFKNFENFFAKEDYLNSFESLNSNENLLIEHSYLNHLKIYNEIQIEISIKKEKLFNKVLKQFEFKFEENFMFEFKFKMKKNDFWYLIQKNENLVLKLIKRFSKKVEENFFNNIEDNFIFEEKKMLEGFNLILNEEFELDWILKIFQFFNEQIFSSNLNLILIFWNQISFNFQKNLKKLI